MKKLLYLIVTYLFLVSCSDKISNTNGYIALDEIKYSGSMQEILTLHEDSMVQIAIPDVYIADFLIYDSLLITDTHDKDGLLDILSIDSYKSYGKIFEKGKAKGEFGNPICVTLHMTMGNKGDSIVSSIYDFSSGRLYEFNVTKFLKTKRYNIKESKLSEKVCRNAFWVKTINDSTVLYRYLEDNQTHQSRVLTTNRNNLHNRSISTLNQFEIPIGEDINIMSSLIALSPSKDIVAEAMLGFNHIHIYSLYENKGITLCVGEELDRLEDVLSKPYPDRKYVFADIRAYKFGFAVLKFDVTEKIFQTNGKYTPSILFFDWKGNALGEIRSNVKFNHFDYDERNSELYILDSENRLLKKKIVIPSNKVPNQ